MNKHFSKLALVSFGVATTLFLSGCTMGPDYQSTETELSEEWISSFPSEAELTRELQQWWQQYQDPNLNALVERALTDNLSLQVQLARIEQARAELGFENANRWPLLSAQASAAREQQPETLMPTALGGGTPRNQFSVAGVLSYEVDLWGRLARQREAAGAMLAESMFGTEAVKLNLVADVVTTYFNLLAIEQQYAALNSNIASLEQTLELEQLRYNSGSTNVLNLRRAEAAVAAAKANVPDLREARQLARSALAILVGATPEELLQGFNTDHGKLTELQLPQELPAHTPSELLQRRPDVRAAEASLIAANARIGVAQAARFPSLNLMALGGSAAMTTGDLFSAASETWSVGADLAGPLFDFGRLARRVESAKAQREQAEIGYQQAILAAVRDASDAIALLHIAEERSVAVQAQYDAIADTYRLAEMQYDLGAIGFYELLASQRELINAELALTTAKRDHFAAYTNVFKAFGGGWAANE
ncbi:efflux transporter outer membrane subunit [Aliidiomarina haloalkalitolerans]|uniref:RND transporter n=1 Tax=Aliidiomarina haloalkalitolerans TaxID=859059 RepID=A0A432VYP8_9GAMM|nr:efflux transporter outer membrane subunit [Aliidiomarina haloalkalitolerans]RUO21782.1 RND transporter [Aliidiomarina haloalkalitolerans]